MNKAIIDIGSNSVRLLLTNSGIKYIRTTMLANKMHDGFLHAESIKRTVLGISELLEIAKNEGVAIDGGNVFAFATEAVRAAKNGAEFASALSAVCDITIDVLSAEDEARVAFLGAAADFEGTSGVIDIGGASVEYAYGSSCNILYNRSLPIGAIALKNLELEQRDTLQSYIKRMICDFDHTFAAQKLVGIGGTVTSLAAMDIGLTAYDPKVVHGHSLSLDRLRALEDIIFSDCDLLGRFATLKPSRASIIRQGVCLLTCLLPYFGKREIIVSEEDNLEGYIKYKKI